MRAGKARACAQNRHNRNHYRFVSVHIAPFPFLPFGLLRVRLESFKFLTEYFTKTFP
jgi:hypothetical protein